MSQIEHPSHYGGADNPYECIKECSQCKLSKSLKDFPPDGRRKDGRGSKCRDCVKKVYESYYDNNPEKEAQRRLKQKEHGANWYQRNRESQMERMRWNNTKAKYGVDKKRYFEMLEGQDGGCLICLSKEPGRKDGYFSIDHDHETGLVRGLLCHPCNVGVGMLKEDPEVMRQAAEYIERSRGAQLSRTS